MSFFAGEYDVIIIGAGHLGHALANYGAMKRRGFNIMGNCSSLYFE